MDEELAERILDAIRALKAATRGEMCGILLMGQSDHKFVFTLQDLVKAGRLNYKRISGLSGGHRIRGKESDTFFMRDYINARLYYISDEDLREWIVDRLPKSVSGHKQAVISNTLRCMGIDIEVYQDWSKGR
jgi:hypothetical protein